MPNIQNAVSLAISVAKDDSHGYDQASRYGPDYDCSSLVAYVLAESGFNVSRSSWTGNLKNQLIACGFKTCTAPWKPGDIHLNERDHVCISISATDIVEASINEYGDIVGGKTGDQTGNEIRIRGYYNYPWDCHLRYEGTGMSVAIEEIARKVMQGEYGNYPERKQRLEAMGLNYNEVQAYVDNMYYNKNTSNGLNIEDIAMDVIRGKYGNYPERKTAVENLGVRYEDVQRRVDQILSRSAITLS